jgi:hypothetical protein
MTGDLPNVLQSAEEQDQHAQQYYEDPTYQDQQERFQACLRYHCVRLEGSLQSHFYDRVFNISKLRQKASNVTHMNRILLTF